MMHLKQCWLLTVEMRNKFKLQTKGEQISYPDERRASSDDAVKEERWRENLRRSTGEGKVLKVKEGWDEMDKMMVL